MVVEEGYRQLAKMIEYVRSHIEDDLTGDRYHEDVEQISQYRGRRVEDDHEYRVMLDKTEIGAARRYAYRVYRLTGELRSE